MDKVKGNLKEGKNRRNFNEHRTGNLKGEFKGNLKGQIKEK